MTTGSLKFILSSVLVITAIGVTAFITPNYKDTTNYKGPEPGFALVELFTSEGCSSCPPADKLAERLVKETQGMPIYILAYHVDYWDRLGWKDTFSSAEFSARQRRYAGWFNRKGVYTPQVVVNGQKEFVGSNESLLRSAIDSYLQTKFPVQLKLNDLQQANGRVALKYTVENRSSGILTFAVVQKSARVEIKHGENGGKTLSHVNVVRKLQYLSLNAQSGRVNLTVPKDIKGNNLEIIGFIQNDANGEILAAERIASVKSGS